MYNRLVLQTQKFLGYPEIHHPDKYLFTLVWIDTYWGSYVRKLVKPLPFTD